MKARSFAAAAIVFVSTASGVSPGISYSRWSDTGPWKSGLGQQREVGLPVDHALAHRAVPDAPAGRGLLPVEILQRDHRQPLRGEIERGAPAAVASLDHRVTHVEVIPRPFGIERVDHVDDVPDVAADVARVVVEPHVDAGARAQRRDGANLLGGRVALLPRVDERIPVVARLEERDAERRRRLERRARDGIGVGQDLRRDHRHGQAFLPDHGRRTAAGPAPRASDRCARPDGR